MLLERIPLFEHKKDLFIFLFVALFILSYTLLIEYNNYKNITKFDSVLLDAKVLKQYKKTKQTKNFKLKTYQVLKLKTAQGFSFYTTTKKRIPPSIGRTFSLEVWMGKISFFAYMTNFYTFSKIINIHKKTDLNYQLNNYLDSVHQKNSCASIYKALYSASPLPPQLQSAFSSLGISHLLAISGFHLGVLATLLYFLFKPPYRFLQERYFPYRSYKLDSFIFIASTLLAYLLFLDAPPSLVRAYGMLLVGFVLYDRGIKIISMQTLFITLILLLSLFPRLFFALGFWLSMAGVFYIFLFLLF